MTIHLWANELIDSLSTMFYGKQAVTEKIIVALLCRGHVLIEDVPGVGKTLLAQLISKKLAVEFSQIQCTPDLLPADILGVSVFNVKSKSFVFRDGPIMSNIVLIDEINRATPRTQSALLEAMAEGQITIEGKSKLLPDPFFLIATESSNDTEGTFPLPEVQKDRFFLTVSIGYPDRENERLIMQKHTSKMQSTITFNEISNLKTLQEMQKKVVEIHVDDSLREYIRDLVYFTRSDKRLLIGVSPRGSLALYKSAQALSAVRGRDYVTPEDIQEMLLPILSKRIIFRPEEKHGTASEKTFLHELLNKITVPPMSKIY